MSADRYADRRAALAAIPAILLIVALLACNLTVSTEQIAPNAARPAVVFLAPAVNSAIAEDATIQIAVNVEDKGGAGVARVDFTLDGALLLGSQNAPNSAGQPSFTALYVWTASGAQGHTINATAYRADQSVVGDALLTLAVIALPTSTSGAAMALVPSNANTPATLISVLTKGVPTATKTPTLTSTSAPVPITVPPGAPQAKVSGAFINIRSGPGANYQYIGALKNGDVVTIIGRNADRTWWVVQGAQLRGWVINTPSLIQVSGDTTNVPLAAAPPSPIATVGSATALPALVPTSTPR